MRFLVVSKGSGRGVGESQAARYVARRKGGDERRTEEPTKLFNAHAENLGDKRANLWLGEGQVPATRDVQHLVLSFAHEEDFLALGEDEAARQEGLRELTRVTMAEMAARLNAPALRWVAGIHRNTDNPHVHLLLQRNYADRAGRAQRLSTKRPEWWVRYEQNEEGKRLAQPSPLSEMFARHWETRADPRARATPSQNEREILGRAWLAQAAVDALALQRVDSLQFSEYRRYFVVDEAGRRQRLSANDVAQAARRYAGQLIAALPFDMPVQARQGLRERLQAQWLTERQATLDQLAEAQAKEAAQLTVRLAKFQQQAEPLGAAARGVQQRYEKEGIPAPLPLLSSAALTWLQERAIRQGDAQRLASLEEVRLQLAAEKNTAPRTEPERARFVAQQILAEARLQTERQKAAEFATHQHLYRWEIPAHLSSESAPQKVSLASIERVLRWESDQAKFIGARAVHWNDERRAQAQQRVAVLTEQQAFVRQKIAERQTELGARVEREAAVVNTLDKIAEREKAQQKLAGQNLPAPRFQAAEMRELELLATRRGDPEFSRTWLAWERIYDAQNQVPLVERTSRALARVILAEITQHEVTRRLRDFADKRERVAVLLLASDNRESATARLTEVLPRSRWERAFPSLAPQNSTVQAVQNALAEQEQRLAEERLRTMQNRTLLTEAAQQYVQEFQQAFPHQPLPFPAFRRPESERFADYVDKETNPTLRAHYEPIYQAAAREMGDVLAERESRDRSDDGEGRPTMEWER